MKLLRGPLLCSTLSKRTVLAPLGLPRNIHLIFIVYPQSSRWSSKASSFLYLLARGSFSRSQRMDLCISSTTPRRVPFPSVVGLPLSLPSCSSVRVKETSLSTRHKLSFGIWYPLEPLESSSTTRRFAASVAVGTESDRLPADIQVTEAEEPNCRVRLSVEVPPAVCQDCYRRVIKEFMKQAKVPGFRPGKSVPESILLSYVGKQNVQKATVESILKRTLPHAMSSVSGRALKDSVRIMTKYSDMEQAYSSNSSLRYDVVVDVAPEVKWVPEDGYKNLKIVVEIDREIDAQKACDEELKRRYKSLGALKIVADRGLQIGDVAVLDISATTIDQDESKVQRIPSAESKGYQFDTEDGDKVIPGFLDSIIGIQPGETKAFPLAFPESWRQENLRGVNALFTVDCKELFYRQLPELDDSLADKLLPGCSSLKEVEESLLAKCREVEDTAREQATDNAILDQLRKMVEIDIPLSLFEEQGRQLYGAQLLQMQASMNLNEQQLASLSSPETVREYLEDQKENIISVIKQNMAVGDIFKRENLQVQEVMEGAKVLEWLREHAQIQYVT
ncbi:hypothetical protein SAY86_003267 [Trapa natans]|uniref:peptidylprolyl isomerase n=1 Tax=Trapa natans TaxID=22666 RepID=A0AAN7RHS3_TRANT|nr:hypothetical protein SAY86_003267 [Trapa natans]